MGKQQEKLQHKKDSNTKRGTVAHYRWENNRRNCSTLQMGKQQEKLWTTEVSFQD
jgi:hypothetical protein